MEAPAASIRLRSWDLDNISWTPIYTSAFAWGVELENGGSDILKLRTDPDSAASEHTLASGATRKLEGRFPSQIAVVYAKTTSSVGPLKVTEFTNGAP